MVLLLSFFFEKIAVDPRKIWLFSELSKNGHSRSSGNAVFRYPVSVAVNYHINIGLSSTTLSRSGFAPPREFLLQSGEDFDIKSRNIIFSP
jgi:hypothetical protein